MTSRYHTIITATLLSLLSLSLLACAQKLIEPNILPNKHPINLSPIEHWQHYIFSKKTDYSLQKNNQHNIIKAASNGSASMLYKKLHINLNDTPYLNWRWKVSNTLGPLNEQSRSGDDYPARIYIAVTNQALSLQPQALNYVWSSSSKKLSHWKNAYNRNSIVIALESGDSKSNQWLSEKRNLKEDLANYLGYEIDFIEGIAIMTDTDNSHTQATAYYANIFFSAE